MLIDSGSSEWIIIKYPMSYMYKGKSKKYLPILLEYRLPCDDDDDDYDEDYTWKNELKTKMHAKEVIRRKFGLNAELNYMSTWGGTLDHVLSDLITDYDLGPCEAYFDEGSINNEKELSSYLKAFNLKEDSDGIFELNYLNSRKYFNDYCANLDEATQLNENWFGNYIILFENDIDIICRAVNLTIIDPLKFIGADGYTQTSIKTTITNNNMGGNTDMNMMDNVFGRGFGSDNSGKFKMSMMGVAIKNNEGNYVCYDTKNNKFINVMDFVFDMEDMFFKMPVTEVKPGDLIIHQGEAVYVCKVDTEGIKIVNPETGKKEEIVPQSNMMGFNFYTKVFSMLSMFGGNSNDNPMGMNIGAMMMFGGMGKGMDGMGSMMQAAMFSQMMGGQNMFTGMFGQPTKTTQVTDDTKEE